MIHLLEHFPYSSSCGGETPCVRGAGTPGERVSLSFSLRPERAVPELELTVSGLTGSAGHIDESRLQLHVVLVWAQAGIGIYRTTARRVAELLLKDDRQALVDSYSRRCGRAYHIHRRAHYYSPPRLRLDGPVRTALEAAQPKQFWITILVPETALPGHYEGAVIASNGQSWRLELEVYPFRLETPKQDLLLWYKGRLDCAWPRYHVSERQFRSHMRDIRAHGFTSLSLSDIRPRFLARALRIAAEEGFQRRIVLTTPFPDDLGPFQTHRFAPCHYISDEMDSRGERFVEAHVRQWKDIKARGGRTMASLNDATFARRLLPGGDLGHVPDALMYYLPRNRWHFAAWRGSPEPHGTEIYYYWHAMMEKPNLHRVLAGLYLWKSGAHGIAPYCYQHLPEHPYSPYDDFDTWEDDQNGSGDLPLRDHCTTYPAASGAVATVQWEGMAEGITDLRYLQTLQTLIDRAAEQPPGKARALAAIARQRRDDFLSRIDLATIDVLSPSQAEPYPGMAPQDFHRFREVLASDIAALGEAAGR